MKRVLKALIDANVLDYSALVLTYYHKLGLSALEAMALIRLQALLAKHDGLIKPKQFSKWLGLDEKSTEAVLASLMSKGYLRMQLVKTESGKEKETFDIDLLLTKVIDYIDQTRHNEAVDTMNALIQYIEDTLQKPLSRLDIEFVSKWIDEDSYTIEMIKEATLEALKVNNPSMKVIDKNLLKRVDDIKPSPRKKEVLKEFLSLWDE